MWGQAIILRQRTQAIGIIPMRVGTSFKNFQKPLDKRDHPHACGDKTHHRCGLERVLGSSPCVWGQVYGIFVPLTLARIIPMRVGTSKCRENIVYRVKDHPHACGDKELNISYNANGSGSSPCVWGQGIKHLQAVTQERIIPMRVGTSDKERQLCSPVQDHPHACGDKTKEIKENSGFAKSTA